MSTTTSGSTPCNDSTPHNIGPGRQLRLLSYNIQTGITYHHYGHYLTRSWRHLMPCATRRENLDGIAAGLDAFDLVALQETDAGSLRTGFTNQTEYLARQSRFPYWLDQTNRRLGQLARHSNGLLCRFEPNGVLRHRLPGLPGRGALVAQFVTTFGLLGVFVLHLALGRATRLRQMRYLAERVNEFDQVIFMGDLNCDPWSPEMQLLIEETRLQAPSHDHGTFPSWRPRRGIDHILVTPEIGVRRSYVPHWRYSDHLPIAMDVTLPDIM